MFICPECHKKLKAQKVSSGGVFYYCPQCKGRSVGLGLLRKIADLKSINQIWQEAGHVHSQFGRDCPSCRNQMTFVSSKELELDVCRS